MCAEFITALRKPQPPKSVTEPSMAGTVSEPSGQTGFFRNPDTDGDLLKYFDLSWWTEVDPQLDEDGRISPKQAEQLLQHLKGQECVFERNLTELSRDRQQRLRGRYTLLRNFLSQAIAENAFIYTVI
jgi:hypothetical protein